MKKFTFIDLFAGIGGFHLAMQKLGGKCVFASEIDEYAKKTYKKNFGIPVHGDITKIPEELIPAHDVLCAGFPCQAFSKAGKQKGLNETRGTLFFDIARILDYHRPKYIILENVRNLVSHDKGRTWKIMSKTLKDLGYQLTEEPIIISPHHLGIPQLRERVIILGVYNPEETKPLNISMPKYKKKSDNSIYDILEVGTVDEKYYVPQELINVLNIWDEFYLGIQETTIGFPVWLEYFKKKPTDSMAVWRSNFVKKNNSLYENNESFIEEWLNKHNSLKGYIPSYHKLEWQAGKDIATLWEGVIQLRPSGIRVKRPDCFPALVAMVQVPIIGKYKRYLTVKEAARLQSFPETFKLNEDDFQSYKQLGNAVNTKVIETCARALFDSQKV